MFYNYKTKEVKTLREVKILTNKSAPKNVNRLGDWYKLEDGERPVPNANQKLAKGDVVKTSTGYKQTYKVVAKSAEELKMEKEAKAEQARMERDRLLAETDYLVMPDYPIKADMLAVVKAYRQALRDVTKQKGFPDTINWPVKPEV